VAIAGATGFAGQELVRILARHPAVTLTAAMSSGVSSAPRPLPALARIWEGAVEPLDLERLAVDADIVFLALPEAASAELAPALLARGRRVIDLSGAFRIRSDADRQRWYPATAALPEGTAYGFSERHKEAIADARLVSNPGCYPTAALLALEPLHAAGVIEGPIVVDAKSGISGAGKTPSERTHFSENHGSVAAYGIFSHRHTAEIEQELSSVVTFVPHLVPLDRGILETIYAALRSGTTAAAVGEALRSAYADAPFVRLTGDVLPEIKHVAHTNFCDIGWKVDESGGRLVMVAVLDNLVKGAAGSAVQNLNIMLGIDERTGLL
jgi:N-acetyl-gamma-glutamyl-phosphate reductase